MIKKVEKTFIPKDKPKSWVIMVSASLTGLLLAGPILLIGFYIKIIVIEYIGILLLIICGVIYFVFNLLFLFHLFTGKYKNIVSCDWDKQLW